MTKLVALSPNDGVDIYNMLSAIPANENGVENSVSGKTFEEFKVWLQGCHESSLRTEIVDGWKVPQTTYWLYVDETPIGFSKVRHFLTDALRIAGGNIGYSIAPEYRGRGYGKLLLKLTLDECTKNGMSEVLVTVLSDNTASLRTALSNGGRLEKQENGRYYIWFNL